MGNPLSVADKINDALLDPMQEYQPPIDSLVSVDRTNPENEICEVTEFTVCNVRRTVLPRSNLTHAVRSRFVRFAAAVRAVRGYGSCGSRLRFVRFAVTVRAVSGRGSCGSRLRFMRFLS